jgi:hypothetical protein
MSQELKRDQQANVGDETEGSKNIEAFSFHLHLRIKLLTDVKKSAERYIATNGREKPQTNHHLEEESKIVANCDIMSHYKQVIEFYTERSCSTIHHFL